MDACDQATIAHILFGTGKLNITLLRDQQGEVERIHQMFQEAIWIIYTNKTFLFLPSPSPQVLSPIQGTYLEIFEYFQFQGEYCSAQGDSTSLDGFFVLKEECASLESIFIAQSSQRQEAMKVAQELSKLSTLPQDVAAQLASWQSEHRSTKDAGTNPRFRKAEELTTLVAPFLEASLEDDTVPAISLSEPTSGGSFHGIWRTDDFGEMTLTQSENWVLGHYTGRGGGKIQGNIRSNRLDFSWQDKQESEQNTEFDFFNWQNSEQQNTGFGFLRTVGDSTLVGSWQYANDEALTLARVILAELVERTAPSIEMLIPAPAYMQGRFAGQELVIQKKYDQAIPLLERALARYREVMQQEKPGSVSRDSDLLSEARILTLLLECDFAIANDSTLSSMPPSEETQAGGSDRYGRLLKHLLEAIASYRTFLSNTFLPYTLRLIAKFNEPYENLHTWQEKIIEQATLLEQRETGATDQRIPRLCALAELLTPICEHLVQAKDVFAKAGTQIFGSVEELIAALTALQEQMIAVRRQVQTDFQAMQALEITWPEKEREFLRGLMTYLMILPTEIDGESSLIDLARNGARNRVDNTWKSALKLEQWLDRWRVRLTTDHEKIAVQERNQPFFADMIEFLVDMKNEAEALVYAEHARARAFLDLLEGRDTIRERLRTEIPDTTTIPSPVSAPAISLEDLQDIVRQHRSTIIEYFMSEQKLFVWVISPQEPIRCYTQALERQLLETKVKMLLSLLNFNDVSEARNARNAHLTNLLRDLYADLIRPLQAPLSSLSAEEVITIIPHGALLQIPFATLQDQYGLPLIKEHAIVYASSIATLRYTAANRHNRVHPASPNLLAFVNPAPFADPRLGLDALQRDFQHIRDFYEHRTIYSGMEATKQRLTQEAADYNVLCFATHAQAFDDEPLRSYLALAPVNNDDGYLRVPDIFPLVLHADLVILLACETGKGQVTGDGVIGLSRAFTWAGTSSLLISLWPIPESESANQIYLFHEYWFGKGYSKAQALRMAQLESMRYHPEQPDIWAAFILLGEWT